MAKRIDLKNLQIEQTCFDYGSYGDVYKAKWKSPDGIRNIAIKEFRANIAEHKIERELKLLSIVNHENIITLFGYSTNLSKRTIIIMEFATCGSLDKILKEDRIQIPYAIKHNWILQFANGLNYLHRLSPKIIHRDLKPQNLLITDKYRTLKICDFGTVKELSTVNTAEIGTPLYMAPEVSISREYSEKCDVYSFGIVFLEVVSQEKPFANLGDVHSFYIRRIVTEGERPRMDIRNSENAEWIEDIIELCWHQNPENRPTMQKVLNDLIKLDKCDEIDWNNFEQERIGLEKKTKFILGEEQSLCSETSEASTPITTKKIIKACVDGLLLFSSIFSGGGHDRSNLVGSTDMGINYLNIQAANVPLKEYAPTVPERARPSKDDYFQLVFKQGLNTNTENASSMNIKMVEFHEIKLDQQNIGSGSAGDIHKAIWNVDDEERIIATKVIRDGRISKSVIEKINSLADLRDHENILSIYGLSTDDNYRPCILMEHADCGSLNSVVHEDNSEDPKFSEESVKSWMLQFAMGMSHLHENNITHCDLKTNILLLTNNYETLQIGGLDASTKLSEMSGTGYYMAPEVLNGVSKCTKMSDVYSFGVIVWEVFSRKKPFYNLNESDFQILMRISKGEHPNLTDVKCKDQDKICELITKCWNPDPELRPTMNQIVDELLCLLIESPISNKNNLN